MKFADIVKKSKVKEIQRHIQDMVGNLERRVEERQTQLTVQPQAQTQPETVQESKTVDLTYFETSEYAEAAKKAEVEKAMKTIELVQIWQEETVEIIRLVYDLKKIFFTIKENLQKIIDNTIRLVRKFCWVQLFSKNLLIIFRSIFDKTLLFLHLSPW